MNNTNLSYLLLIIIILITIIIICNNKIKETFEVCENEDTTGEELQKCLQTQIMDLKKSRSELKKEVEKPYKKGNYMKKYYDTIEGDLTINLKEKNNELKEDNYEIKSKIQKLKDNLKYINSLINLDIDNKQYNSIKSLQNGTKISLIPIGENSYLIKINTSKFSSGYITANENGDICLKKLQLDENKQYNNKQLFEIIEIKNETQYKTNLDRGLLVNQFYDYDSIVYPFSLIRSKYNKNCLQNFNNKLSLMTCKPFKSHRFEPSKEKIMCKKQYSFFK